MKWDDVLKAASDTVMASSVLQAVYGGAVRLKGTGTHSVPLLEFTLIADGESELWAPHTIQWDQFVDSLEELIASEKALRHLFHRELPVDFAGLTMWSQYSEGDVLATPDRDGYYGRGIRFRMTPLRSLYDSSPA